jgi:hypothetical protein
MDMERIHTICVPRGWSPEQAWEAISRGDKLPQQNLQFEDQWVNVETDINDKFIRFMRSGDEENQD